jgi:hypothetical protein
VFTSTAERGGQATIGAAQRVALQQLQLEVVREQVVAVEGVVVVKGLMLTPRAASLLLPRLVFISPEMMVPACASRTDTVSDRTTFHITGVP